MLQEVQVLKALVLGEEERGQSQYQVMCFVCHVNKDEFISSDAMSKLRQVTNYLSFYIYMLLQLITSLLNQLVSFPTWIIV
ncbi:hypothetical protein O3M35_007924 [Rhynocoris fuscipes]|uniref:Out at first protein BRICHOS-like domain-containing protein n=1 Tax=Rhynocoris fuscipes TaxID=488301 RepID=A0AAW1DBX4_9HEMI